MKYNELGQSGIKVSELCLGTMTWGSQNSQSEANKQINEPLDVKLLESLRKKFGL